MCVCVCVCVCVSGGGSDKGLRGRVTLSLLECMTAMFCHPTDECGVMAAEKEEEEEGGGGGGEEERRKRKEGVSRRRRRRRRKKKGLVFLFFSFSPHSMRKLGHPSKAIAGNKSSS